MAFPSGGKNSKRKHSRATQAPAPPTPTRKARVKNIPLNAPRDAFRKQELRTQRRKKSSERQHGNDTAHFSNGLDVVGLVSRRTRAFLELPSRMAGCHSPFELWREQARYVQEVFSDYQSVAQRMMASSVDAFLTTRGAS
jgi:hypothetical protein